MANCTNADQTKRFQMQHCFDCHTCGLTRDRHTDYTICAVCIGSCHLGHKVSYDGYKNCFCDCGLGKGVQCTSKHHKVKCTYKQTGRTYVPQHMFGCRTCGLNGNLGCCAVCANECHKGHDVYYVKHADAFFCDCPERCACKANFDAPVPYPTTPVYTATYPNVTVTVTSTAPAHGPLPVPAGTFDLSYSNGHHSRWTIDHAGHVSGTNQDGPGNAKLVYGLTGMYRHGVVELIDLVGDQLYITHFTPENPRAPITATGTRTYGGPGITGAWDINYSNGHKSNWSIDSFGNVSGTNQDGPGRSRLTWGVTGIYRPGVVELVDNSTGNLRITHYMPENWHGVITCNGNRAF